LVSLIGQTISHYTIFEKLGEGGIGVVYKAEDTKLNRSVALKFLAPAITPDPLSKERFSREAQLASGLQHSNICVVYDLDETSDGLTFIVMEYYDGEPLTRKIERGPLPIEDAVRQREGQRPRDKSQVKGILVLPFENLSSEKENEYFSDGLTEEVITSPSKLRKLRVCPRATAMRYKGTHASLREIAGELISVLDISHIPRSFTTPKCPT
jgi:serine/threonine protein kinase